MFNLPVPISTTIIVPAAANHPHPACCAELQCLEKIEGLQGCPHLRALWLIENKITAIENLEPCTALQELYLTSNRITTLHGLDHLTALKVSS